VTTPFVATAAALLAIPILLYALGVLGAQLAGLIFGVALLGLCTVVGCWPAFLAAENKAFMAALVAVALGMATLAGFPLVSALYPGPPVATASLTETGKDHPLSGIDNGGEFDLVIHADIGGAAGKEVYAKYEIRILSGDHSQNLSGSFESQRGRGRAGRSTVSVVRPPPEWVHHPVSLPPGKQSIRLVKKDASLEGALEVKLFSQGLVWPFAAICAGLLLASVALAARLRNKMRRQYLVGGLCMAASTGILGAHWAWIGQPFYPVLGAAFIAVIAGWLVGKLFAKLADHLPWALR
jgi:hypothetical protein